MAATQPGTAPHVPPGKLFRAPVSVAENSSIQRFRHDQAGLDFLDCAELRLGPGGALTETILPGRESLLIQWKGSSRVTVNGAEYTLDTYDMLYMPLGRVVARSVG